MQATSLTATDSVRTYSPGEKNREERAKGLGRDSRISPKLTNPAKNSDTMNSFRQTTLQSGTWIGYSKVKPWCSFLFNIPFWIIYFPDREID